MVQQHKNRHTYNEKKVVVQLYNNKDPIFGLMSMFKDHTYSTTSPSATYKDY